METPKSLSNVETQITGSVRQLCAAAADACRALGYQPLLLTDHLDCEAREAGRFLADIARTHAGPGGKRAFLAGGETVVHLTGQGLGGRNQELALAAAPGLAGLDAALFSVGSDGTDGPTDAAGGYVDGGTLAALTAHGLDVAAVLAQNDAYHALAAVDGLLITGPFSILVGFEGGMMALNDRLKLRSLVVAERGDRVYFASEEAAIREVEPELDRIWAPNGGEPVIVRLKEEEK